MLLRGLFLLLGVMVASSGYSYSFDTHDSVNSYRSKYVTYQYISQSLEAGNGSVSLDQGTRYEETADWKSMGLKAELGLEMSKLLKMSLGLAKTDFVKPSEESSVMDKYSVVTEGRIYFSAPIFNVELGAGVTASTADVFNEYGSGVYSGTGMYYTAVLNRFFTNNFAVFSKASMLNETLKKDSGELQVDEIKINNLTVGLGITLYR